MNRYRELMNKQQEEVNALPLGFAFSNKQFAEMMQDWGLTIEDTDKILRLPGGGFIQKKDSDKLHETLDRHDAELKSAIAGDADGTGFIYASANWLTMSLATPGTRKMRLMRWAIRWSRSMQTNGSIVGSARL